MDKNLIPCIIETIDHRTLFADITTMQLYCGDTDEVVHAIQDTGAGGQCIPVDITLGDIYEARPEN